jgi:mono/diheme cytochrome c family protein
MDKHSDLASAFFLFVFLMPMSVLSPSANSSYDKTRSTASQTRNVENGRRNFNKYGCYECHGLEGQGSIVTGPRLGPDPIPLESFTFYVRKPAGQMPPYTDKVLSDNELAEIYAFLQSVERPRATNTTPLPK